jgi:hypothetical protein
MNINSWMLRTLALSILLVVAMSIWPASNLLAQNSPQQRGAKMSLVKISICIDDAHLSSIEKISQQLQVAGASIEEILSSIGIINATISADRLDRIERIEGVKQVERQEVYQITPPHS